MKSRLFILFVLLMAGLQSCDPGNVKPEASVPQGKAIAFIGYSFPKESHTTAIYVLQTNKTHILLVDGLFQAFKNNTLASTYLEPGVYYFTRGVVNDWNMNLKSPKKMFTIKEDCINYIGTYELKFDMRDQAYFMNYDAGPESFEKAKQDFILKNPNLSTKYDFVNAVK